MIRWTKFSHAGLNVTPVWRRHGVWALMTGVIFGLLFAVHAHRLDSDFGWHLEAGRYILQHGVPAHDVFTYTAANFPWINHEWLSDVLIALLYGAGGFVLVAALFAGVWTAAIMLALRRPAWVVGMLGVAVLLPNAVARPSAFTALGLAILLWLVDKRRYWPVMALFALWANLHGGFVLGFVVLGLAGLREWRNRQYWLVLAGSVLATFLNPYGPRVYEEIWRTLSDQGLRSQITEWHPLAINILNGLFIVAFLFVVLASRWRREFVLPVVLLAATVLSQRQFSLFVLASLPLLVRGYEELLRFLNLRSGRRRYLIPAAATALAGVVGFNTLRVSYNYWPVQGAADLRARVCTGNVFNEYDFGGYLIWQVPGIKVYIDGRMPSWRMDGVSYLANWRKVLDDGEYARSEFARHDIRCAVLQPQRGRLIEQLKHDGWRVTAQDPDAVTLRRD